MSAYFVLFKLIVNEEEAVRDNIAGRKDAVPRSISKEIIASGARIESLVAQFVNVWQRSPSEQETSGLRRV